VNDNRRENIGDNARLSTVQPKFNISYCALQRQKLTFATSADTRDELSPLNLPALFTGGKQW